MVLSACATSSPEPVPIAPPSALVTALPSLAPVAAPSPAATSTKLLPSPSSAATPTKLLPTPFITAPAPNEAALVPILMYHHLKDLPANASELELTWTVAPKNFQAQIEWLAQKSYHAITMADLNAHLKQRAPLPSKPIVISFDDGWEDGYTVAFPTLKKHHFIGTFFPYTQPLGYSKLTLTWEQIREMSAAGMDFQGHTLTHPHLTQLTPDNAAREIAEAKKTLETRLNKSVVTFAYPFGEYNSVVLELVKRAGFESAVTIDPGYRQRVDRIYQLQRIRISYKETLDDLQKKLPPQ
jgi:peptidoglycan/xylan/chitin deacetylase (PgdA/CDA1 family)